MNIIEKNGRALLVVAPFVIALVIIWVIYDPFHMISDKPPGGNPGFAQLPLWLWVIGIRALGSFMLRDPAGGKPLPRPSQQHTTSDRGPLQTRRSGSGAARSALKCASADFDSYS